jgi:predicted nicotinamide N-methyase
VSVLALAAPPVNAFRHLLERHAPLRPVPLCPELRVHYAHSLTDVWEAAERIAGHTLPSPFWAWPWAGGIALARLLLDRPDYVRGRTVLDFGAGGGVASIAAAVAGAARVVANDIDAWALEACRLAAAANRVVVETLHADLCDRELPGDRYDLVLCSDLAYERTETPRQQRVLGDLSKAGAAILAADAGRTYFEPRDMKLLFELDVPVPKDLEGDRLRRARVFAF